MKEINWNRSYGILFKYGGISGILLSGIALYHRWYTLGVITQQDLLEISPSFSISIAIFALGLSFESTEKMVSISQSLYLGIRDVFEDKRLSLRKQRLKLIEMIGMEEQNTREFRLLKRDFISDYSFSIWKCVTYLRQTNVLLKWIKKQYQNNLVNLTKNYFQELVDGRDLFQIKIIPEHKRQIQSIYEIISNFKGFNEKEDRKEQIVSLLHDLINN